MHALGSVWNHRYYRLRNRDWKLLTWAIECARALRVIVCNREHLYCSSPLMDLLACMAWPGIQTFLYLNLTHLFFSESKIYWQLLWISPLVWTQSSVNQWHACWLSTRSHSEHSVSPPAVVYRRPESDLCLYWGRSRTSCTLIREPVNSKPVFSSCIEWAGGLRPWC